MNRKSNRLILVLILISMLDGSLNFFLIRASAWEIDKTGIATYIVDGDTLDVSSVGRIRLADIDCPEVGEPGADAATQYLKKDFLTLY